MAFFNVAEKRNKGFKLALIAACLAIVVITLGAFTRLSDAGLGCPDWPGCYGHLMWPDEAHEIKQAEELFPDAPVDTGKTWPEMVHRYFAGSLGILIVILAWFGWRNRDTADYPFRLPMFLLFLVVWQALFGMWTVTLKLWPQVVTLHLLGGFTVFNLLWLLTLRLDNKRWQLTHLAWERCQRLKPWAILGIVILVTQILLGGWLSSNYAAFACHDLPTCHGSWWPEHMDFVEGFNIFQTVGPNYLGGLMESDARVAIHVAHRLGAMITALYLVIFAIRLVRLRYKSATVLAACLVAVLTLQVSLGISNILLMIPLPNAVAHNGVGAILLATMVTIAARIWMAQPAGNEG